MAPMTRSKSKNHIPGEDVAAYYRRRAEGGVGLIITEGTVIGHKAAHGYPDVPNLFGDEALKGWSRVVDQVHQAGGKIFPQLWHVGSVRQTSIHQNSGADNPGHICDCQGEKIPGFAPSPIPHPHVENGEVPHEMTLEDIEEVIEAYVVAAQNAKDIGFDGIEIHAAHGYLIDQFFWSRTNKRTDRYGGEFIQDRTLFAVEVTKAIRRAVGDAFPIGMRISQWKMGDYSAKLVETSEELERFIKPLAEAGIDLFHCSTRRFYEAEFPGSSLNLAGWVKKLTGKPTITVGSIGNDIDFVAQVQKAEEGHKTLETVSRLAECLEKGEFDLAAVGRSLLADPNWLAKVIDGKADAIKPFSKDLMSELY